MRHRIALPRGESAPKRDKRDTIDVSHYQLAPEDWSPEKRALMERAARVFGDYGDYGEGGHMTPKLTATNEPAKPTTAPHTTTTTRQWQAKMALIDSLNTNTVLDELDGTVENIAAVARFKQGHSEKVSAARQTMDEAKALLVISGAIDGKNAEIREAQLTTLISNNPEYQALQAALRTAEREANDCELELGRLRGRETALKVRARIAAATLEFLAS